MRRLLKAGIMEEGLIQAAEVGTPQGAMLSPLLFKPRHGFLYIYAECSRLCPHHL